jgi:hypothetical protein
LRRRKTRTRRLELTAALAVALSLSACGGGGKTASPPPLPTFPRSLASSLASQSDAVAAALTAGESCRALTLARQLQQRTIAAINRGQVAGGLQEQLSAAVNELVARVHCVPPASPAPNPRPRPTQREHRHGKHGEKHEKHEKHKKHGEGD